MRKSKVNTSINDNTNSIPKGNDNDKRKDRDNGRANGKQKDKQKDKPMDMSKHLPHWINNTELRKLGGRYIGVIARVIEQIVHNRYAAQKQKQPVIIFVDGYRLIPNIGMRRELIGRFGEETDTWSGQTLVVSCQRAETVDSSTGVVREKWTKHLTFAGDRALEVTTPDWVNDDVVLSDEVEPIGMRDEDELEHEGHSGPGRRG